MTPLDLLICQNYCASSPLPLHNKHNMICSIILNWWHSPYVSPIFVVDGHILAIYPRTSISSSPPPWHMSQFHYDAQHMPPQPTFVSHPLTGILIFFNICIKVNFFSSLWRCLMKHKKDTQWWWMRRNVGVGPQMMKGVIDWLEIT